RLRPATPDRARACPRPRSRASPYRRYPWDPCVTSPALASGDLAARVPAARPRSGARQENGEAAPDGAKGKDLPRCGTMAAMLRQALFTLVAAVALTGCSDDPPSIRMLEYSPNAASQGVMSSISGMVNYTDSDGDISQ